MNVADIKQELTTRNESVERLYSFYISQRFLVNRRYQRKLVWSIEEKRAFIDSLRRAYPVPLILLADVKHQNADRFEIIDGMQRLNAMMSFIEGEFDLDQGYFDLEAMAETKLLLDNGDLSQKTPKLAREICVKIVGYSVPLTVYPDANHSQIDEVFRRINAYGKHLSRQELRVAGVTTSFSQVVRKIASMVRGDVSAHDKLYLGAMKAISITSRDLPYGLNVDNIFWVTNNILTREYIRQSRDEELIADMLGYILLSPKLSSSAEIIDEFFGYSSDGVKGARGEEIETMVNKIGVDLLIQQYMSVHSTLREIISAAGKKFSELILEDGSQRVPRYFQAVFLGLWELLVNDQLVIRDFAKAAKAIDGCGVNISIGGGGGRFSAADRERNTAVVVGLLKRSCSKRKGDDPALSSWSTEFENLLSQSRTEQALYDFKQGFMLLDGSGREDEATYSKVFKTLSAMANQGKGAVGYVIVGVADSLETSQRLQALYKIKPIGVRGFEVFGVDHEAVKLPKKMDTYFQQIVQKLNAAPISDWAKAQIARDMRVIRYFDKSVVVFRVEAGSEPCAYDGKYYERHGANLAEVQQQQFTQLFKRFLAG